MKRMAAFMNKDGYPQEIHVFNYDTPECGVKPPKDSQGVHVVVPYVDISMTSCTKCLEQYKPLVPLEQLVPEDTEEAQDIGEDELAEQVDE